MSKRHGRTARRERQQAAICRLTETIAAGERMRADCDRPRREAMRLQFAGITYVDGWRNAADYRTRGGAA